MLRYALVKRPHSMVVNRRPGNVIRTNIARSMSSWSQKEEEMSPRQLITDIRNKNDPQFTLKAISRGWADKVLPYDEIFLKEYIKAAIATRRFDSMDLNTLLADYRASAPHNGNSGGLSGGSESNPIHVVNVQPKGYWVSTVLKYGLYAGLLYFLFNSLNDMSSQNPPSGGGGISSRITGAMRNNIHIAENPDKTFDDVVGVDEAKAELKEIVLYLKQPQKFTRLGGKLPKGVLLTGPPGTGKTLLAKAIAGEAGVPFFYTSGSEFEEMFVGVGARRVRDLFEAAKARAPCIIFIDEVDAIGGSRHLKDQSSMKMTLNQLLVEMDGFETNNGVVVIAATNFPDSLDNALTRPGRLDKHVDVPLPDIGGRTAILNLYGSKVPLAKDVDMEQISRGTPGFSGADLFNLVNQAALRASVQGMKAISMSALEYAKDKIMMGSERQSAIISEETIKRTAYHEAGHAVVAHMTSGADPIHKATVMPRGRALGMVMQLPEGDQTSMTRKQMLARLDVCMGGRVAEELIFGAEEVTSGASSDIQQATNLARAMVTKFGMSEKVGMIFIDDKASGSKEVESEVKELLSASYKRATECLKTHQVQLEAVAKGLIDYETLSGSEVVDLIEGKPLPTSHEKRSQKPSRDIVPIINRTRPQTALNANPSPPKQRPSQQRPPSRPMSTGGGKGSDSSGSGGPSETPPSPPAEPPSGDVTKPPPQWGRALSVITDWFYGPSSSTEAAVDIDKKSIDRTQPASSPSSSKLINNNAEKTQLSVKQPAVVPENKVTLNGKKDNAVTVKNDLKVTSNESIVVPEETKKPNAAVVLEEAKNKSQVQQGTSLSNNQNQKMDSSGEASPTPPAVVATTGKKD